MKQLLNGVAIAAVFALAAPALGQNLVSPPSAAAPSAAPPPGPSAAPPPAAPAPAAAAAPAMAKKKPVHRAVHHVAKTSRDPEGDQLTQQLNQQVLDRTGSAPPPMPGADAPPPPMPPMPGPGMPPPGAR